jgi:2-oxoglutarate ferredoxin oxidoreductase subunit alpha
MVPDMVHAGMGYTVHVTGLTHNEIGYADLTVARQEKLVRRLIEKLTKYKDEIIEIDEDGIEDADVIVLSYGITSRVAERAIQMARAKGLKVGRMRMITIWPFAEERIRELAKKVKAFVVPELNMGQIVLEVERCAAGKCAVIHVPHAGGSVHNPATIVAAIEKGASA